MSERALFLNLVERLECAATQMGLALGEDPKLSAERLAALRESVNLCRDRLLRAIDDLRGAA